MQHYSLTPVNADVLANAEEQWQLVERWLQDVHLGKANLASHPRGTHARHDALEAALQQAPLQALSQLGGSARHYTVQFRRCAEQQSLRQACRSRGWRNGRLALPARPGPDDAS